MNHHTTHGTNWGLLTGVRVRFLSTTYSNLRYSDSGCVSEYIALGQEYHINQLLKRLSIFLQ